MAGQPVRGVHRSTDQCIAVSRTADPVAGGWFLYDFPTSFTNDYPKFGVWPDAYYMGSQRGYPLYTGTTQTVPDSGTGPHDVPNDIQGAALGTDDRTFRLRAELSPGGVRTYTITYVAEDKSGNKATAQATVRVPKAARRSSAGTANPPTAPVPRWKAGTDVTSYCWFDRHVAMKLPSSLCPSGVAHGTVVAAHARWG